MPVYLILLLKYVDSDQKYDKKIEGDRKRKAHLPKLKRASFEAQYTRRDM